MKHISLIFIFFFSVYATAQTRKTFNDSDFKKGDIIKVPFIEVELLSSEKDVKNDSLDMLADFLLKHSNMKFELGCHTDSRGNAPGNIAASQYRADGIRNYLIKYKGVNPDMIVAKGYGESKLLISDSMIGDAKTKEEKEKLHHVNRRIELKVLQ